MCLGKIMKKKLWQKRVIGKSDILEVWCLRYSNLQDSSMVKCKKFYDLKANLDNMQEDVLQNQSEDGQAPVLNLTQERKS